MSNFKTHSVKSYCLFFLSIICAIFATGCQSNEETRSNVLLDNVISKDGNEYRFEQIPWFTTKKELIDNGHIPTKGVTTFSDDERLKLNKAVKFKEPQTDATVIYKFQDEQFIGGEYIITARSEDELVRICTELKGILAERFPDPSANTLEEALSEKSIRSGTSSGVQWWKEDNSGFSIEFPEPKTEFILILSVRAPR